MTIELQPSIETETDEEVIQKIAGKAILDVLDEDDPTFVRGLD